MAKNQSGSSAKNKKTRSVKEPRLQFAKYFFSPVLLLNWRLVSKKEKAAKRKSP